MAGDVVRFWRDFMLDAPDEVGGALAFITAPPADFVPEPVRGPPGRRLHRRATRATPTRASGCCAPLREFGPPGLDLVEPMPYVAVQDLIDRANPHGRRNYWTADFLAELPDEAVDVLVEHATEPGVAVQPRSCSSPGGGAVARVPEDATAFGERTAPFNTHYLSMWEDPADDETQHRVHARASRRR